MLFDNEPLLPSPIYSPRGPTPLWCKLAFSCAITVAVILVVFA